MFAFWLTAHRRREEDREGEKEKVKESTEKETK